MNMMHTDLSASEHQTEIPSMESARQCSVLIWLKYGATQREQQMILTVIQRLQGVNRAMFKRQSPTILMVDYCHHTIAAQSILEATKSRGVITKIIGC